MFVLGSPGLKEATKPKETLGREEIHHIYGFMLKTELGILQGRPEREHDRPPPRPQSHLRLG